MFGNFLYFIVALLIYATYPAAEEPNFSGYRALLLLLLFSVGFALFARAAFVRVLRQSRGNFDAGLDHRFEGVRIRLSILAVALFAVDIYGLSLPDFVVRHPFFRAFPTAAALLFLGLFIAYMAVIWAAAYPVNRRLYGTDQTRFGYVVSNISFSVPVLLPWLVLSGVADLLMALPFSLPKQILATPEGETAYFLFFLFLVAVLGPVLIQWFWRCRPLTAGPIRDRIERVCNKAGLSYADILQWPLFGGRMITAGVMGLVGRFRYILITSGLMRHLSGEEVDAVIAHEIGHVKRHHLWFYLFFFVGYLVLAYSIFDLLVFLLLYSEPTYQLVRWLGDGQAAFSSVLFSIAIIALFLFYFRFVFGYFMRNFERQADLYAYELFETAGPLVSTFQKIAWFSGQAPDRPNWHHFSIAERVDYLKRCEADRRWIDRHHRKVRNSIIVYLAALVVIGGVGIQFNYGEGGRRLTSHLMERIIERELKRSPDNAELYRRLGDVNYAKNRLAEAADAYRKALELKPDDAAALNNLAWLYATAETEELRNPEMALSLALEAAARDPAPHVLDTLAEAYYVNGRFDRAVDVARQALDKAWQDKDYFRGQLERFEKAARK
ncbi:MAG: M48 family metalloprotease [Desulfobacterales bacterium]|jgi:Zn-dependent protease with chaperone function